MRASDSSTAASSVRASSSATRSASRCRARSSTSSSTSCRTSPPCPSPRPRAAPRGGAGGGVAHQEAPHHRGGDAEEGGAARPVPLPLVDQPQERLVDQVVGLEGMAFPLVIEVPPGEPPELAVDQRHELLQG